MCGLPDLGADLPRFGTFPRARADGDAVSPSLTIADLIIAKFGGLNPFARALGHRNASTVQGWRERGTIPVRQIPAVQAAAAARGLRVHAGDFLPGLTPLDRIFDAFGGPAAVGRIIHVSTEHAATMRRRGSIPVAHWRRLLREADHRGVSLTADDLVDAHDDLAPLPEFEPPIPSGALDGRPASSPSAAGRPTPLARAPAREA